MQEPERGLEKISFDAETRCVMRHFVLRERPYVDRVAWGLVVRLALSWSVREVYHQVLDELDYLEGLRSTSNSKREEQFKRPPLRPLWHKHFYAPREFFRNVGIRWNVHDGKPGNRDLERLISELVRPQPPNWHGKLAHDFVLGGYSERANECRLTGDWIIFAKYEGKNYYLDVATHREATDPAKLLRKLRNSAEGEFPFAFGGCGH